MTAFGTFPKVKGDLYNYADFNAIWTKLSAVITAPVGSIVAWPKTFTNTPALIDGWVECDGSVLSDSDSVYDGQTIPDNNGSNYFLRGNSTSGGVGGSASITLAHTPNSTNVYTGSPNEEFMADHTFDNRPPFYDVVWIWKVK